ncbi:MAG: hypothetical protein R3A79_31235 [Nannocystaceae bacterium]
MPARNAEATPPARARARLRRAAAPLRLSLGLGLLALPSLACAGVGARANLRAEKTVAMEMEHVERVERDDPELTPQQVVVAAEPRPACRENAGLAACRMHPIAGDHGAVALAAGHGVIGLLLADGSWDGRGSERATLVLHDRALAPVGEATLRASGPVVDAALTATSDGWFVALATREHIEVLRLNPAGEEAAARLRVDKASSPRFAADPRDPSAPLLAWAEWTGAVYSRGAASTTRTRLFDQTTEPNFAGQVAVGAGDFLVSRRGSRGVEVVRVGADGVVRSRHADVGTSTEYPTLVRCDDGPRMIWSDFAQRGEIRWARLDDDGALVGPQIRLSGVPDHFNHAPAICAGVDTLVLLTGYTGGTGLSKTLDLARVDAQGARIGEPLRIYDGAAGVAYRPAMIRDGDALFVAWGARVSPQIALARVDLERAEGRARRRIAR